MKFHKGLWSLKNMVNRYKNKRPVRYCLSQQKGFTMVELAVVVLFVAIFSAVAYPMLTKSVPNMRLKAASQELYSHLQKAKLHAVKTNNDVLFSFTADVNCLTPTGYVFTDEEGFEVVSKVMAEGVCLESVATFDATSGFTPRALPAGPVGSVTLTHKNTTRQYVVAQSTAGNIRIQ